MDFNASAARRPAHTLEREWDGVRFTAPDVSLHFFINIAHEMLHDQTLFSGSTQLRYLLNLAEQIEEPHTPLDWDWLAARQINRRFRLALDLQGLMLKPQLRIDPDQLPDPDLQTRVLHRRRIFKMRRPQLGLLEFQILKRGLRMAHKAGLQTCRIRGPAKSTAE